MAILCPELGLLYLAVGRTGSWAVRKVLEEHFGGTVIPPAHIRRPSGEILVDYHHATVLQLIEHGFFSPEQLKNLKVIAVTRNPFDWLVSVYFYFKMRADELQGLQDPAANPDVDSRWLAFIRVVAAMSFKETVVAYCAGKKMSVCGEYRVGCPVDILRFESLQEELAGVLSAAAAKNIPLLPRVNASKGRPSDYRSHYDEETRAIVEEAFESDLQEFGYRF